MKRLVVASLMALAASVLVSDTASAQQGFGFCGSPYGIGLPYARVGGAVRTPPYFAVHPPVYYGARYARPYGLSPFASSSMVTAPAGYQGQPAARFYRPPAQPVVPTCNPYIIGKKSADKDVSVAVVAKEKPFTLGKVQTNPFVQVSEDHLAKN